MILPGISGSVIAVILDVYDKILYSINDIKNNYKFLIKTIIGIVLGIVIGANIILKIYNKYYNICSFAFMGLILGTIPFLLKNYYKKTDNKINITSVLISISLTIILGIRLKATTSDITSFKLFISGIFYSIGKIVPGISSTALLSSINMYEYYLNIFSNPIDYIFTNFNSLILILFGILIGTIILIKLITYLLNNFYEYTYSSIIGFSITSAIFLFPNNISFLGILFLFLGFILSFLFSIRY